jgi:hypothetical protein
VSDIQRLPFLSRLRNAFQAPPLRRPAALATTLLGVLVASLGCAGSLRAHSDVEAADPSVGSEQVFATVEAAVGDAFEAARRDTGPTNRDRLRIGAIRRVDGGFAWSAPARSSATVDGMRPMRVRVRFGPDDVALYGVQPRSGLPAVDRRNEAINSDVQRLVDEQDPLHRPIYMLTPSRRIVTYQHDRATLEVVSRDEADRR